MENIIIRDAKLGFRNFAGRAGDYNDEGSRCFSVLLPDDVAESLKNEGWNVKWREANNDGEDPQAYLVVAVGYKNFPPKINVVHKSKHKIVPIHGEDQARLAELDWVEIEKADVSIRPHEWEFKGRTGVKAWLKTLYVTIVEDEFSDEYSAFDMETDPVGDNPLEEDDYMR